MITRTIYKDASKHVKAVFMNGSLLYTVTYFYDSNGFVEKTVRVFASNNVDVQ